MSVNDSLPHGGRTWCPWPHDPPEGWPYEYVARVDYLQRRLRGASRRGPEPEREDQRHAGWREAQREAKREGK